MRYWMMRLFLTSRERMPLFEAGGIEPPVQFTRQQYLAAVFGKDINFRHRRKAFTYKFFEHLDDGKIAAVIAREHTLIVSGPPSLKFAEKRVRDWETANVFIDISSDENGQKVAMHALPQIGGPLLVFRSLVDEINKTNVGADWVIAVNPITRNEDFWSAVKKTKGRISEMSLTFIPPNIWRGQTETESALRKLHAENKADEIEVKLKNSDHALNPDGELTKESAEYISKGGGRIYLKDGKRVLYDSDEKAITVNPPGDTPVQGAEPASLMALIREILRL